jgi:tetratricopeptide (TPR) repeat protein
MEELLQDHLPEFYETLAYHYSQSDNFQKAYEYLMLSGGKAAKNYAYQEAIRFYREAIRMLDAQPESLENKKKKLEGYITTAVSLAYLSYPEGTLEIFQNAEKLAHELGDEKSLVTTLSFLSLYHANIGNPSLGREYAEKCFNSAEKIKDFGLMAHSAGTVCVAYWVTGDVAKVVDIGSKAIHLLEENHLEKELFELGYRPYLYLCIYCGMSLAWLGKIKEGTDVLEKGFRNAYEVNDKSFMGPTKMTFCAITYWAGYGEDTIAYAQEAIKIYGETESSFGLDSAWFHLEGGYYIRGEYEKAIDAGEKSLSLAKEFGMPMLVSWSNIFHAMTLWAVGDLKRAREYAEEALRIAQECGAKPCEGMARIHLGYMLEDMTPAIIEKAQRQIRHGISIFEELKLKTFSAFGYFHLGKFLVSAGRKEEALQSLKKAEALYLEMEVTPQSYWLTRTKDAMAKLR